MDVFTVNHDAVLHHKSDDISTDSLVNGHGGIRRPHRGNVFPWLKVEFRILKRG